MLEEQKERAGDLFRQMLGAPPMFISEQLQAEHTFQCLLCPTLEIRSRATLGLDSNLSICSGFTVDRRHYVKMYSVELLCAI